MFIANATGCSSIWGGSYPYNPYTTTANGKGPAWANSLFEDNAEFGYGMFIGIKQRRESLYKQIDGYLQHNDNLSPELRGIMKEWIQEFDNLIKSEEISSKMELQLMKEITDRTKGDKKITSKPIIQKLLMNKDVLCKKSQWIVGGDGWAYDIGYGGLDHVLASGENVNILVLDTEMYSNTGGQASKSSPRSSVVKFAQKGKTTMKKDLGAIAMSYQNIYVAQIAIGGNMNHTVKTLLEAEAYDGPSIVIAYCPCIGQGLRKGLEESIMQQKKAVESGYWLLYRYNPLLLEKDENPLKLDSKPDLKKLPQFINTEVRFSALEKMNPMECKSLSDKLIHDCNSRYVRYCHQAEETPTNEAN